MGLRGSMGKGVIEKYSKSVCLPLQLAEIASCRALSGEVSLVFSLQLF